MPAPLIALVAAAIYEVRSPLVDVESLHRTLGLVTRAAGDIRLSLEVGESDLVVNGVPVPLTAPGAAIIRQALVNHATHRLVLPPRVTLERWREIVELYASAPGLYSSLDDLRDALRSTVPDAVVSGSGGPAAEGDLRDALFELPGLRAVASNPEPVRVVDPRDGERAELMTRLDPMLQGATEAQDRRDYARLAQVLLQIYQLEDSSNDELRAIVARERRRVVPTAVLESMARMIPKPGSSVDISRVLGSMGREGAAALFNALSGAPGAHERRAYIDALVAAPRCDDAIVDALGNSASHVVRDGAEIAGRKRLERATPALTHLLKHREAEVRTAAWHALERIGTPAAMKALRT
ncbi:MAG: HEAT repeat domain-containing protein [Gemmatimonadales bacterium]